MGTPSACHRCPHGSLGLAERACLPGQKGQLLARQDELADGAGSRRLGFSAMGKPGVLFLAGEARSKPPSRLRWEIADALNRTGWGVARNFASGLAGSSLNDRAGNAFKILIKLGPDAEAAVPAMVEQINSYSPIPESTTTIVFPSRERDSAGSDGGTKGKRHSRSDKVAAPGLGGGCLCRGRSSRQHRPKGEPAIPALLGALPHSIVTAFSNAVAGALWKIDRQPKLRPFCFDK